MEEKTVDEKIEKRLELINKIKKKKEEAARQNRKEVIEEDKRNKLPEDWISKQRKLEWEIKEAEKERKANEQGIAYCRVKNLHLMGLDAEAEYRRQKERERRADQGFSDFREAAVRSYKKKTQSLKPNFAQYELNKKKEQELFYIPHFTEKVSEEAIDRVVEDVLKQDEKRKSFSRRRTYDEEADIDYINERNRRFNQKLERVYGKHTAELKENLERGTAL